jgi:type IV pilus assembly protein PilC
MNRTREILVQFGVMAAFVALLAAAAGTLYVFGLFTSLPLLLLPLLLYGWVLFAFLGYRTGRQEEFMHVLSTAVESNMPLAPALRAYVRDRPHGTAREIWVGALLFPLLPGYYWVWHRQRNYDRKVEAVAQLLEEGVPLYHALLVTPGVVSREALMAVAVGEITGKMALSLRGAARSRLAALWLEMAPRVLYPLAVLVFILAALLFWQAFILPRLIRIFADFNTELPAATQRIIDLTEPLLQGVALTLLTLAALGAVLLFSSTARWYFPGVGRIYRMHARGRVLRMLGLLLEAGKPAPEALALLADSEYFPAAAEGRLDTCRNRVVQGESLADSLYASGLLPRHMASLVRSAERAQNLPWALAELGESLSNQAFRLLRRASMLISPLIVLAIGLVVGFVVVGLFVPMIKIIESLAV